MSLNLLNNTLNDEEKGEILFPSFLHFFPSIKKDRAKKKNEKTFGKGKRDDYDDVFFRRIKGIYVQWLRIKRPREKHVLLLAVPLHETLIPICVCVLDCRVRNIFWIKEIFL